MFSRGSSSSFWMRRSISDRSRSMRGRSSGGMRTRASSSSRLRRASSIWWDEGFRVLVSGAMSGLDFAGVRYPGGVPGLKSIRGRCVRVRVIRNRG